MNNKYIVSALAFNKDWDGTLPRSYPLGWYKTMMEAQEAICDILEMPVIEIEDYNAEKTTVYQKWNKDDKIFDGIREDPFGMSKFICANGWYIEVTTGKPFVIMFVLHEAEELKALLTTEEEKEGVDKYTSVHGFIEEVK